ncbi:gamma carbonic anhydrase family protein [Azohydromonas caseinilytica]|uniref:Gamma carbonic anhydrase family protein n=1 Tax=Azohydromonas caseinilytica TaxID=2728836 RepID=A0A848FB75_9BURK|nr:gamma carbonic anhydrase family protein [Azohydromonas caseinilytica]NML16774.1 gamma carbonic anhydrase family protein [Azohydromonas caseinilytica]
MSQYRLGDKAPCVDATAFVAPDATLVGDVRLGAQASVWFQAVARGDNEPITIGARSNVQEGAVLHADPGYPLAVGERVTVGHQAMLHGCTIGEGSLIGIQAVILNGARIGKHCLVGAGAIVTEHKEFPDRSLILGAPAKVVRQLSDEDVTNLEASATSYAERAAMFATQLERVG